MHVMLQNSCSRSASSSASWTHPFVFVLVDEQVFREFYRQQGVVEDGDEFEGFMRALFQPLPVSFRVRAQIPICKGLCFVNS